MTPQQVLRSRVKKGKDRVLARFFKTGPGEYGEGDLFIGVMVPEIRQTAKDFSDLQSQQILKLLRSKIHEERLLALLIWVQQFQKKPSATVFKSYLQELTAGYINNWDLVDLSAEHIIGAGVFEHKFASPELLTRLAKSNILWERRVAMLATFHQIKKKNAHPTFKIASLLLKNNEKEDLMHKATGWMLREVGKRIAENSLEDYLKTRYQNMPRTMLRYAIERFAPRKRLAYLKGTISIAFVSLLLLNACSTLPPSPMPERAIGMFDSGTGGLTVLEEVLKRPELQNEQYIYYGDQANMPYGHYPEAGKLDLLLEHITKDARFLTAGCFHETPESSACIQDPVRKPPIKALVVACNTATSYGLNEVKAEVAAQGLDIPVIGVVNAGARAAVSSLSQTTGPSTIGVFATAGTVSSEGYVKAIAELTSKAGTPKVSVVQQGGPGLAEAIDGENAFISKAATSPRSDYRGPAVPRNRIKHFLLDQKDNALLCDRKTCQLNSAANYARYYIVSLADELKKRRAAPMQSLILGCTHYPYVQNVIEDTLQALRKHGYKKQLGAYIQYVDPAVNTALELSQALTEKQWIKQSVPAKPSNFFISIPNRELTDLPANALSSDKLNFNFDYKYSRKAGTDQEFVWAVPFSRQTLPKDTVLRIQERLPRVFKLLN